MPDGGALSDQILAGNRTGRSQLDGIVARSSVRENERIAVEVAF